MPDTIQLGEEPGYGITPIAQPKNGKELEHVWQEQTDRCADTSMTNKINLRTAHLQPL